MRHAIERPVLFAPCFKLPEQPHHLRLGGRPLRAVTRTLLQPQADSREELHHERPHENPPDAVQRPRIAGDLSHPPTESGLHAHTLRGRPRQERDDPPRFARPDPEGSRELSHRPAVFATRRPPDPDPVDDERDRLRRLDAAEHLTGEHEHGFALLDVVGAPVHFPARVPLGDRQNLQPAHPDRHRPAAPRAHRLAKNPVHDRGPPRWPASVPATRTAGTTRSGGFTSGTCALAL